MALFQNYTKTAKDLIEKMQTFEQVVRADKDLSKIHALIVQTLRDSKNVDNPELILKNGAEIVSRLYKSKALANDAWAEHQTAAIAHKQVRDALMLSYKGQGVTVTEARAEAGRETAEVENDVIRLEKKSKDLSGFFDITNTCVIFMQSLLSYYKAERAKVNMQEQGR